MKNEQFGELTTKQIIEGIVGGVCLMGAFYILAVAGFLL